VKRLTITTCVFALSFLGCAQSDPGNESATAKQRLRTLPGDPGANDPVPPEPPQVPAPEEFAAAVNHSYFPLVPGTAWTYVGEEDGVPRREEISVLDDPVPILGVPCAAVQEQIFVDGELSEMTTQYYAQDLLGNVWRFGEESVDLEGGVPLPSADSWEAGVGGALPWIALAAAPQVGDLYIGTRPGGGTDEARVLALGVSETVPAGAFTGCMEVEESNSDDPEDVDRIIYAPGVGVVSETSASSRIDLVSYGVR